jgi:hypothetical protein
VNARETAERHGRYVIEGNWGGVGGDFAPGAMEAFQKHGVMPPRKTSSAEIVNEQQDGDHYVYDVKYANDAGETLTIRSKWGQQGDEWKITEAMPVS